MRPKFEDSWALLSEAVRVRRVDRMLSTKLWLVIYTVSVKTIHPRTHTQQRSRRSLVRTHVAMAMTARPIIEANNTRHPNCSRMGIRILTMRP